MISEVADQLNERIAELATYLLGEPNRDLSTKMQLRFGSKGSIAVEVEGPKRGRWYDHEDGAGGDGLELIRRTKGVANGAAVGWGREWLGLPVINAIGATAAATPRADRNNAPGDDDADREAKVERIIAGCTDVTGTPAELYLRNRGVVDREWPSSLRFRPNAYGSYGALVALATDADGEVHALQQIYLTADGQKAPVAVQKRTNKTHDSWSNVATVRLAGKQPLVLAEGVETALSIWRSTGQETWACLGIANISRAPVPNGLAVIVASDGDEPEGKACEKLQKSVAALQARGHDVSVAAPPLGMDFNDMLVEDGEDAVRAAIAAARPTRAHPDDWQQALLRNDRGQPLSILANAIQALRNAPEWQGVLCHDAFAVATMARNRPPWIARGKPWRERAWSPHDDLLATEWLQQHQILVTAATAGQAIEAVAQDNFFHPVREYLDGLTWDGVPRVERWLSTYIGAAETSYTLAVGARWLISAVARLYQPGAQADCVLILEGPQGIRKSSALRVLGGEWFTDRLSDLGSKDAAIEINGVWIVEIAELDTMSRAEVGTIKAFITRIVDRFRPPYGKRMVALPRQCVFAGTVNPEAGYLKDPTGGRRFWPVTCGKIDLAALGHDRDQIWAEACHLYRAGQPWWLETRELEELAAAEQADRYQGDAWDELIQRYVSGGAGTPSNPYRAATVSKHIPGEPLRDVSVAEVLEHALALEKGRWTQADQSRVARSLTSMGFVQYRGRSGKNRERRYRRSSSRQA